MLSTHLFDPNRSRDDLLLFILKKEFNVEQIEICFDITIYSLLIYTLHCCACIFIQSYQCLIAFDLRHTAFGLRHIV